MDSAVRDRLTAVWFTIEATTSHPAHVLFIVISWLLLDTFLWFAPLAYALYFWYDYGSEERGGWNWQ